MKQSWFRIMFNDRCAEPQLVRIGNERDHCAETLQFVLPQKFNEATAFLHMQIGSYADVVQLNADRTFTPTRSHTQYTGKWTAYIEVLAAGDVVWHSDVFYMSIGALPADGEQIEQQYPTLLEQVTEQARIAATAAEEADRKVQAVEDFSGAVEKIAVTVDMLPAGRTAEGSASMTAQDGLSFSFGLPKGDTGDKGEKGDPGSKGEKGDTGDRGPVYTPSVSADGVISWTNNGGLINPASVSVRGPQGEKGERGDRGSVGAVGPAGPVFVPMISQEGIISWYNNGGLANPASVSVRGPQGEKGDQGPVGTQGPAGKDGADGKDGYTPVRGTDYWTEEDQAAILKDVTALSASQIVSTAAGDNVQITDSASAPLRGLILYGRTTQNSTPAPNAPVPLVSVGEGGWVSVMTKGDTGLSSVPINTPNGLPGIPVDSGGNYTDANGQQWICDEIDFARGVYVQRIVRETFDGSENWLTVGSGDALYYAYEIGAYGYAVNQAMLCDHFAYVRIATGNTNIGATVLNSTSGSGYSRFAVRPGIESVTNMSEWVSWLSENPIEVMYALTAPVETALSAEDIAAIDGLSSYYPTTTVSNSEGAWMEISYVADTKNYIDQKLAAIAAAMVSNL